MIIFSSSFLGLGVVERPLSIDILTMHVELATPEDVPRSVVRLALRGSAQ